MADIPPELIRDVAMAACRDIYPDDPCDVACEICMREAEALLRERDQ